MQSSLKKQSALGHYEEKQCPVPNELQIRIQVFLVLIVAQEFTCDTGQIHHLINRHELLQHRWYHGREASPSATLSNKPFSSVVIYSSNLQHNNVLDTHRSLKRPESTILPKFQYVLTKRVQFCPHMAWTKEHFGTDSNNNSVWF